MDKNEQRREEDVATGNLDACKMPDGSIDPKCDKGKFEKEEAAKKGDGGDPLKRIDEKG